MSAWADDPLHFARFVAAQGGAPDGFAPRPLFGRYLRSVLEEAVASGHVTVLRQGAVAATRQDGRWRIDLSGASAAEADAMVLALGNQAPEPFPFDAAGVDRFIDNPWSHGARAAVEQAARVHSPVLIIGTGLTMVDTVLSLDEAGHRGRIVALSRRGLIPRGHADFAAVPVGQVEVPLGSVRALWSWLRRRSGEVGWHAAIDALRPHSHRLWQSLTGEQRRRFLRHARPWWDVHRHRIAPEVADRIGQLVSDGRLEIIAGRIAEIRRRGDGLDVVIRRRVSGRRSDELRASERVHVDFAFNCTGPLGSIGRTTDPLLARLLADGSVRPDALGIGLDVDERSRASGSERLWAMGPLTKGRYWEIIAVPDIRVQAAEVAEDIAKELGR